MITLLWLACTHTAPSTIVPEIRPAIRDQMGQHFIEALDLEDRVIVGDLAGANAAGARLAAVVVAPDFPELWRPSLKDTQMAAEMAAHAPDLKAAAAATAEVMRTCGECHSATGGGPKWVVPPAPEGPTMAVHSYAATWMGYGLVARSDEAWDKGVDALLGALLPDKGPQSFGMTARALAIEGKAAKDPERRAAVWGQLLTTCANCHSRAR